MMQRRWTRWRGRADEGHQQSQGCQGHDQDSWADAQQRVLPKESPFGAVIPAWIPRIDGWNRGRLPCQEKPDPAPFSAAALPERAVGDPILTVRQHDLRRLVGRDVRGRGCA